MIWQGLENSSGPKYLLLLETCFVLYWSVKALGILRVSAASGNTFGRESILSSNELGDWFHLSKGKFLWEQDTGGWWWCSDGERTLKWGMFAMGYNWLIIFPRSGCPSIGVPFRGVHFFPCPTSLPSAGCASRPLPAALKHPHPSGSITFLSLVCPCSVLLVCLLSAPFRNVDKALFAAD